MRPFFTFYGGKFRAAPLYPAPAHSTIVEPFAGSAGYSLRYHRLNVVLVERDPAIAATWRYLLSVKPAEIMRLPDIGLEQTVDELSICEEARLLVGWWLNGGSSSPKKRPSSWMRKTLTTGWETGGGVLCWGEKVRKRIASQVEGIRHWKIIEGDYTEAPDVRATWFVDPPYQEAGRHYRHGSSAIDYEALACWCVGRSGQVLVCENVGADWLPFEPWREIKASEALHGGKTSKEALFVFHGEREISEVVHPEPFRWLR